MVVDLARPRFMGVAVRAVDCTSLYCAAETTVANGSGAWSDVRRRKQVGAAEAAAELPRNTA